MQALSGRIHLRVEEPVRSVEMAASHQARGMVPTFIWLVVTRLSAVKAVRVGCDKLILPVVILFGSIVCWMGRCLVP